MPRIGEPGRPGGFRSFLRPLATSVQGMTAQQRFLEVIAANIANAETTRTADGGPYQRQVARLVADPRSGAVVTDVQADETPGRMVYDPGHADADAAGYVRYPNVDASTELADLMVVRRLHEANASVFQAAKSMLRRALDI